MLVCNQPLQAMFYKRKVYPGNSDEVGKVVNTKASKPNKINFLTKFFICGFKDIFALPFLITDRTFKAGYIEE